MTEAWLLGRRVKPLSPWPLMTPQHPFIDLTEPSVDDLGGDSRRGLWGFFFLAGNMGLSAVRYPAVILPGMRYTIISGLFFISVCFSSFHFKLHLHLLSTSIYPNTSAPQGLFSELKTDDHHSSAIDSFTQNTGLWLHSAEINSDKRIMGLRTTEQNI